MAYKQPSDTVPPYDSPEHSFVHPGRYHSSGIPALHQIPEPRPTGNSQSFHEEQYHDPYNSDTHSLNRSSVEPWDSASQRQNSLSSHHTPSSHSSHLHNKPSHGGLSYIDEEGAYYHSDRQRPASAVMSNGDSRNDLEMRGLMGNAADMGRDDEGGPKIKFTEYQDSPHPYPPANYYRDPSQLYSWLLFPTGLDRLAAMLGIKAGQTPLGQAIERKKRGLGGQRWPVAAWSLAVCASSDRRMLRHSDDSSHRVRIGAEQSTHRFANCYQTKLQLYDWPNLECTHQHWGEILSASESGGSS